MAPKKDSPETIIRLHEKEIRALMDENQNLKNMINETDRDVHAERQRHSSEMKTLQGVLDAQRADVEKLHMIINALLDKMLVVKNDAH